MNNFLTSGWRWTAVALVASIFLAVSVAEAHTDSKELPVTRVKGDLSVLVLGSSGPQLQQSARAESGYLIFVDGKPRILMDAGGGTFQRLAQSGANLADIDIILLSHLHIDHTQDLPAIIKGIFFQSRLAGKARTAPFEIWGPNTNGEKFPQFPQFTPFTPQEPMFPSTSEYLNDLFGPNGSARYLNSFTQTGGLGVLSYNVTDLSPDFAPTTGEAEIKTIYHHGGLVIKAVAVNHNLCPAAAYRIEYKGKTIVYSGDTSSMTNNMERLAKNADLVIYDTAILDNQPPPQSVYAKRHTTPTRMGQVVALDQPRELVLSHLTPVTEPNIPIVEEIIREQGYMGRISEAQDLKVYNVGDTEDADR